MKVATLPNRLIVIAEHILLLATLFNAPLLAQEAQSHQRGLTVDTAYQLGSLDSINLFNGNLILTLPIGTTYPVGPDLSYGINLIYNSNGWAYDERTCLLNNAVERYAVPIPDLERWLRLDRQLWAIVLPSRW